MSNIQKMLAEFSQFVLAKEAANANATEKAKPGPKPGKKALASEVETLRAEVAALRGQPAKAQAAANESAPADYAPVWTALKAANITHYGAMVKASSWASAQLDPIFGAAFGAKVGESKKGSAAWDAAILAGKAAKEAALPAVLSAAAKMAGVDFAKLVG